MASRVLGITIAAACLALCPLVVTAQVLDIGTDAVYAGPYPGGIENTVTGTVVIDGLQGINGGAIFSGVGGPGENAVLVDSTFTSIGSPLSGLFVDSVANTIDLSVGDGMTSQGLFIDSSATVLTGGSANPTTLLLDDFGVLLEDSFGGPVPLQGVADGIGDFDAVNVRQLNSAVSSLSSGIASVAALAAIPCPVDCKNYSFGLGYGHFNGENAGAIGFRAQMPRSSVSFAAGAGFSENASPAYNAGVSFSF